MSESAQKIQMVPPLCQLYDINLADITILVEIPHNFLQQCNHPVKCQHETKRLCCDISVDTSGVVGRNETRTSFLGLNNAGICMKSTYQIATTYYGGNET
jgi:hypothetical protein